MFFAPGIRSQDLLDVFERFPKPSLIYIILHDPVESLDVAQLIVDCRLD